MAVQPVTEQLIIQETARTAQREAPSDPPAP